jgi:hypothetical protein
MLVEDFLQAGIVAVFRIDIPLGEFPERTQLDVQEIGIINDVFCSSKRDAVSERKSLGLGSQGNLAIK